MPLFGMWGRVGVDRGWFPERPVCGLEGLVGVGSGRRAEIGKSGFGVLGGSLCSWTLKFRGWPFGVQNLINIV